MYPSPLLAADEVEVRETAKLSRVVQWVEVQFLHTTTDPHSLTQAYRQQHQTAVLL